MILRNNIEEKTLETNIKFLGKCAVKIKGWIANGVIKEVMRKADAIESENEHMKEIIVHNTEYVDIEVRNVFTVNKIIALII